MRNAIKSIFNILGLEIRKKPKYDSAHSYLFKDLVAALNSAKDRGIMPSSIIDVGAAEGHWTIAAMNVWEKCDYLLFEPLEERKAVLKALEKKYNNIRFINAGAGSRKETISFYVSQDLDGSGVADKNSSLNNREIEVRAIDEEISRLNLKGPYVIKLDTHGFEVPILQGAMKTLENTSLVIIECYCFHILPESLLFWEMCNYMDGLGFRPVDMIDLMWRKKDKALWQLDIFFVPKTASCFNSNTYD
jgi:FkbM family methyltransferase